MRAELWVMSSAIVKNIWSIKKCIYISDVARPRPAWPLCEAQCTPDWILRYLELDDLIKSYDFVKWYKNNLKLMFFLKYNNFEQSLLQLTLFIPCWPFLQLSRKVGWCGKYIKLHFDSTLKPNITELCWIILNNTEFAKERLNIIGPSHTCLKGERPFIWSSLATPDI